MSDRAELMDAALDVFPEAVVVSDGEGRAVVWNRAAEALTGFPGADILGRTLPPGLAVLNDDARAGVENSGERASQREATVLIHVQHKRGHDVQILARAVVLRDGLGHRIGRAAIFHPGEHGNALPHGEVQEAEATEERIAEMEERLAFAFREFEEDSIPLGVLWITVDQAHELRKTHGARACETMLSSVERTLANGLKAGEELGRWGDGEFLVLTHEGDLNKLDAHARVLAGLSRTTDFRWWGDRVSITVSIGSTSAVEGEPLTAFLLRAQDAMFASLHAGGNRTTPAAGRMECSPS